MDINSLGSNLDNVLSFHWRIYASWCAGLDLTDLRASWCAGRDFTHGFARVLVRIGAYWCVLVRWPKSLSRSRFTCELFRPSALLLVKRLTRELPSNLFSLSLASLRNRLTRVTWPDRSGVGARSMWARSQQHSSKGSLSSPSVAIRVIIWSSERKCTLSVLTLYLLWTEHENYEMNESIQDL